MFNLAIFVGSLRKDSTNLALAKALEKLGSDLFTFTYISIADLPHFNAEIEGNPPSSVLSLREKVAASDGVLFITPEYNRSIPGPLKNAIDWGSRPFAKNCLTGKPAATAGRSPGAIGTSLGQTHLRSILLCLDMKVLGQPELFLGNNPSLVTDNFDIPDDKSRKFLRRFVETFSRWIEVTKQ